MAKKRQDNKFYRFVDTYLMWPFGGIGVLGSMYAVWLQSGGISYATGKAVVSQGFYYINFLLAFFVLLLTAIGGYAINEYFKAEAKKSSEYRKLTTADFLHTSRMYIILILIAALSAFFSSTVLWVLVGAGAMMFGGVGLICFKLWQLKERKIQEKEAVSES
ncbi:MAG: hypothetical protein J6Y95_02135 [Lachnospiraceae bacterium]|nr:hypothetical protein [Lachnospiraceae bacterium]